MNIPPRQVWVRALTAHPTRVIQNIAKTLTQNCQVHYQSLPQSGLSLLQLEDGVFHLPYYLGEIPLSMVCIEIENQEGKTFLGAAQVMDDDPNLVVALAVCDAVMANQLPGWKAVLTLINQGLKKRAQEDHIKGAILAKTKVNFSLVSKEEEDADN